MPAVKGKQQLGKQGRAGKGKGLSVNLLKHELTDMLTSMWKQPRTDQDGLMS